MKPSLIVSTPAKTPSHIHFWTLQLLERYSWNIRVPWVFLMSSIHPLSVAVSMKARMRQGVVVVVQPLVLTLTPSMRTAVQMSMSSKVIFRYFLIWPSYSLGYSSFSYPLYSPFSADSYSSSSSSSSFYSQMGSPDASRSLKTWVNLVALQHWSLILFSSEGILLVVFQLVVKRSRQLSQFSSSAFFLQFSKRIRLPSFSTCMFQGYCPPRTVRMAKINSIDPTTLFRIGSSLFIKSDAISASPSSPSVLMLFTLYSSFSLKPTGLNEIRSTFSLSLCSFPTVLISSTFIFLILGTCSERSRLLIVFILVQSFLTVSSLNLVLYWLCQVRSPRFCFLVKVRVLAKVFFRRSPILIFLLMQSLLVTLVLPSTTVNSSSSLRVGTEVRLQHLIWALLKRLKKERGMCSQRSWEKVQSIHYLSQSLKSYKILKSISIVDYINARIQKQFVSWMASSFWSGHSLINQSKLLIPYQYFILF